jgi:hypothetical protein
MFKVKYVRHAIISPDGQLIAFTTGQQFDTPESLWLMTFDVDACYDN